MTTAPNKLPNTDSPSEQFNRRYESVAGGIGTLRQYQDIPLRLQKQWITSFLLGLVLIVGISSLYLNVAAQIGLTGREVQRLKREILTNKRVNADLQTKIALMLSGTSLKERATEKGYVSVEMTDLDYVTVPGYFPEPAIEMALPATQSENSLLQPEYSETLFTWFARQLETASMPLAKEH